MKEIDSISPFFTVITVAKNARATIEETIKSVLDQNFQDYEYIVIDGGSSDGTSEIIDKYKNQVDLIISEPDAGIYDAMNKGIALASGIWICIINSDDSLLPDSLGKVYLRANETEIPDVIYGGVLTQSQRIFHFIHHTELEKRMIFHPATFISKSSYLRFGTFNLSYSIAADYDLCLRIFLGGGKFVALREPLAVYRTGGYSERNWSVSIREHNKVLGTNFGLSRSKVMLRTYLTILKTWMKRFLNNTLRSTTE